MEVQHSASLTTAARAQPNLAEVRRRRGSAGVTFNEKLPINPDLLGRKTILHKCKMMPVGPPTVVRETRQGRNRSSDFTVVWNVASDIKDNGVIDRWNSRLDAASSGT